MIERQYIDLFTQNRQLLCDNSAEPLNALRDEAFSDFRRLGFPTRKTERYRYTDVPSVFAPDYGLNLSRLHFPLDPRKAFACSVPNLSTSLYFVVGDELFTEALPPQGAVAAPQEKQLEGRGSLRISAPAEGVVVTSLRKASSELPSLLRERYGKLARTSDDALTALNTMLAQDGLLVYVPRDTEVTRPIQVVNILRADVDMMVNRRVLVVVEAGARASLLFCDHAADERDFLTTQVMEVFVGRGASLELCELEQTHAANNRVANMYVEVSEGASLTLDSVTLHNGLTLGRTEVTLAGEGAEVEMHGCVVADKRQAVDLGTFIDHRARGCRSEELYKYVLDDEAVCAFAGKVLVREGAEKTVSNEVNANLCSSRSARMYTQPMLEIYADDVKCSHGSTVGQIGEQALFYMRQRGISEEEARMLLKFAFVSEVLDKVKPEPLRSSLRLLTEKRLRGELAACEGCNICGAGR